MATAGAPPKFKTALELQAAIDKYFLFIQGEFTTYEDDEGKIQKDWQRYPEPATITGLAYYLGFESRQSIYDYKGNKQFSYTIKKARLKVEYEYEKKLSGQQPAGSIFALKNLGWHDKQQTELSGPDGKPVETKNSMLITMVATGAGLSTREKDIQDAIEQELADNANE